MVKVIWHKAASLPHTDSPVVFARLRQYAPHLLHPDRHPHHIGAASAESLWVGPYIDHRTCLGMSWASLFSPSKLTIHVLGSELPLIHGSLGPPEFYQCRDISPVIWQNSMNELLDALSVSPNSNESGKQSLCPDGDPDRHQNLIICSLAHCQPSLKISCKSVRKLLRKVANRQTEKQRWLQVMTSLADVTMCLYSVFETQHVICGKSQFSYLTCIRYSRWGRPKCNFTKIFGARKLDTRAIVQCCLRNDRFIRVPPSLK